MHRDTLENFINSEHFRKSVIRGVVHMTIQRVEILPDRWLLTSEMIGNRYEAQGILLCVPVLNCDYTDLDLFLAEGNTEDEFYDLLFNNEKSELEREIRDDLEYELISLKNR
jgi:hypothetical protein